MLVCASVLVNNSVKNCTTGFCFNAIVNPGFAVINAHLLFNGKVRLVNTYLEDDVARVFGAARKNAVLGVVAKLSACCKEAVGEGLAVYFTITGKFSRVRYIAKSNLPVGCIFTVSLVVDGCWGCVCCRNGTSKGGINAGVYDTRNFHLEGCPLGDSFTACVEIGSGVVVVIHHNIVYLTRGKSNVVGVGTNARFSNTNEVSFVANLRVVGN